MLRRPVGTWLAVASLVALAVVPGAEGSGSPGVHRIAHPRAINTADAVPGELIVRYKAGTTSAEKREIRSEQDATLSETLALPRTEVVELPAGTTPEEAAADFEDDPDVAFAQPNLLRHVMTKQVEAPPNDPIYQDGLMWGLTKISA